MIRAEIIAHSIHAKHKHELITFVCTFPRWILAELNTHRMFSRNSASSRAIPFEKMVESVRTNPFIPIAWQKEHKGMQGTEYWTNEKLPNGIKYVDQFKEDYLEGKNLAIQQAEALGYGGATKQIANRLIEPYMWHTAIITTSKEGLENFFDLRCPQYQVNGKTYKSGKEASLDDPTGETPFRGDTLGWLQINKGQAEIHMMALAEAMYDAYYESVAEELQSGEWHIPYKKQIEALYDKTNLWCWDSEDSVPNIAYVSSVMCARVSYTVPDHELSEWTLNKYLDKATGLVLARPLHASPFEHCGPAMTDAQYYTNVKGEVPYIIKLGSSGELQYSNWINHEVFGWNRNFRGFIQMRDIIEKEVRQIKNGIQTGRN